MIWSQKYLQPTSTVSSGPGCPAWHEIPARSHQGRWRTGGRCCGSKILFSVPCLPATRWMVLVLEPAIRNWFKGTKTTRRHSKLSFSCKSGIRNPQDIALIEYFYWMIQRKFSCCWNPISGSQHHHGDEGDKPNGSVNDAKLCCCTWQRYKTNPQAFGYVYAWLILGTLHDLN